MKKILIIEDDKIIRENIAEILHFAGYEAVTAENGKIGVNKAIEVIPDLIICDIVMPVMDGYKVLYLLNKNPATSNVPFIFLTAKKEMADMRKGMGMGADDYLVKPFIEMDLLTAIEARLKKSDHFKKDFSRDVQGLKQFLASAKGTEELKNLSVNKKAHKVSSKEMIYLEDEEANNIFFIAKGQVKTFNMNKDGKELIIGLHRQGDFIGILDLMEGEIYKESAMAIEDSEIVAIPKLDFFSLIYANRDVAMRFIQMLSNDITEMKERLLDLAYGSLRKRIADALISLQKKYGSDDKIPSLDISRENLANLTGITPESISRTLHEFMHENLIDLKSKHILILNREKLVNMKN